MRKEYADQSRMTKRDDQKKISCECRRFTVIDGIIDAERLCL